MKITLKRRGNPSGQIKCLVSLGKDFILKTTTNSTMKIITLFILLISLLNGK